MSRAQLEQDIATLSSELRPWKEASAEPLEQEKPRFVPRNVAEPASDILPLSGDQVIGFGGIKHPIVDMISKPGSGTEDVMAVAPVFETSRPLAAAPSRNVFLIWPPNFPTSLMVACIDVITKTVLRDVDSITLMWTAADVPKENVVKPFKLTSTPENYQVINAFRAGTLV
jgi:hypothetical protein